MEEKNEEHTGKYRDIIISIDEGNKNCVDCNKENPNKVSINNGVVICEACAEQHKQLGTMVSYIRDLDGDFDEYLLNYFSLGSNTKFKRFLSEEKIDESLPIEKKYFTRACDFYRKNLKQKVGGGKLLEKDYENPNEILEHPENSFPEFENYELKKTGGGKKTKVQQAKKVLGNFGLGIFNLGKNVGKKVVTEVKQGANFVAVKAGPATQQLKKAATNVGKNVGKAAVGVGKGVGKAATNMGHKAGVAFSNIKHKIEDKKHKKKGQEGEGGEKEGEEEKKEESSPQQGNEAQGGENQQEGAKEEPKEENPEPQTGELVNQPLGEENAAEVKEEKVDEKKE